MNNVIIRTATKHDWEAILQLYYQLDQHHVHLLPQVFQSFSGAPRPKTVLGEFLGHKDAALFVAESDQQVVGFVNIRETSAPGYPMFRSKRYAVIDDLVVDTDHRGRGIAGRLLTAAKEWAQAHHLPSIQLTVWSANLEATSFYHKHGFKSLHERLELDL